MTEYSRWIYGPKGFAYPGGGDDDDNNDDGGGSDGGAGSLETTPSYQPRKKHHQC